jgi:uncharacterized protein YqeY
MSDSLKVRIAEETRATMRARDSRKLGVLRLVGAEIKRVEVDERRELADDDVLVVLERMTKQRVDSERQFRDAQRLDLAEQEAFEIDVIRAFMPVPFTDDELAVIVAQAVADAGATSAREMGAVMNLLRPRVLGRADMKALSALVKSRLGQGG